ncbi:MAG TPA: cyclopropane-fatty-acyl-phospholipid synthase family protein [Methylomirabilota bacterium]|nr:cyclopropane-fatty-acyl-phospholipid synthase family protein [Methylomirabilota bacterium]
MFFAALLKSMVRSGSLRLIDPAGRRHEIGDGAPPAAVIRIASRRVDAQLALNPALHVGEAYMDGALTIEEGTLYDFLAVCARNYDNLLRNPWFAFVHKAARGIKQYNPVGRAQRNVAHHYDLSDKLYDLFLDKDRQYSCAYFADAGDSLEAAQENKKRHIAAKLLLDRPRLKVLDIGSGWGGLGLYLAEESGADVTGVTLSVEQHKVSEARAARAGLADRVRFRLRDYREESGRYDRIVSVGMFEHVGAPHYRAFFRRIRELLAEDGVALLHSIGRIDPPGGTNAWLQKYIFPGGYTPALSEVMAAVEAEGLWVTDIEILRLHYAETLREWRRRFAANREKVRALYDERFCRMWEFYLTGCELGFRYAGQMVFQMQLARRQEAVPLTRDYMVEWERGHASQRRQAAQ